jgi:hypothetical protein
MFNINDILSKFPLKEDLIIQENIKHLLFNFTSRDTAIDAQTFIRYFDSIPDRDKLSIIIKYAEDIFTITSNTIVGDLEAYLKKIFGYISGDEGDSYEIYFRIEKSFYDSKLSIYSFKEFSHWYYNLDIIGFYSATNLMLENCIQNPHLICLNDDIFLYTKYFAIGPYEMDIPQTDVFNDSMRRKSINESELKYVILLV